MTTFDLQQDFFALFGLPVAFEVDAARLGERHRALQTELHPDRFASAPASEQRLAVQYSARINEAYATLRKPLPRALYLMALAGVSAEALSRQPMEGGFLMQQMELRESLESLEYAEDPEEVLDAMQGSIATDVAQLHAAFASAYAEDDLDTAGACCVKLQYLDKLLSEARQREAQLLD